ncbi:MAG: hypothetical protein EBR86_06785 [Planctomycetia bacterium]|nr:hypothetical protein [Planctomycetia bacterium]
MSPLVNPAALFTFRFPCQRRERLWPPDAAGLDDACRLPSLAAVAEVPDVVEVWLAWNAGGLAIRALARGVGGARWCQPTRAEDSDGLHVWIATRPTGESHRAGRFCRRLALLPTGGGRGADKPVAVACAIPRTTEPLVELPDGSVSITAALAPDGWRIDALLAAAALPGWDPAEMPRLGFFAALVDRRLGRVPLFAPPEYPWENDPTTWAELELVAG